MNKRVFDVPILFIIFRRKETALQVIDAIAKVKPKVLYISQDGARNKGEEEEVLETRKYVLSKINWKCDLKTSFNKNNLGLEKHIPKAFDWFFKDNEYGIYLEDDTLPNEEFFFFQQELLEKYKNDDRIFSISGTNIYSSLINNKYSYYLSQMGSVWGMGIWRRSWKLYNPNVENLNIFNYSSYKDYIFSFRYWLYLRFFLKLIKEKKLNTWDYQVTYAAVKNRMYFITPSRNLVKNIGINNKGTNMFLQDYKFEFQRTTDDKQRIKNLDAFVYTKVKDNIYFDNFYKFFYVRLFLSFIFYSLPISMRNILKKTLFGKN